MSESSAAPAPAQAPVSTSSPSPAPALNLASATATAPSSSRAPAIAVAEHARPPSAAAPPRQPQPQAAVTAAATKTAARLTFRDRGAMRIALVVILWLVHCALWLANAYTLAATSASSKTDEAAPITGAAVWDTAWVEYAAVLGGSSSALTNDAGPAYWQLVRGRGRVACARCARLGRVADAAVSAHRPSTPPPSLSSPPGSSWS